MRTPFLSTILLLAACSLAMDSAHAQGRCDPEDTQVFDVTLRRLGQEAIEDNGETVARVFGDIVVNGKTLGRFYDNPAVMIPAGKYQGLLRYNSDHNFVQSQCGALGTSGDFLLEVANVTGEDGVARTNILIHPGRRPSHSKGCILIPREFDAKGKPIALSAENPLRKLRSEFYGTDDPNQCPNKAIVVTVIGP